MDKQKQIEEMSEVMQKSNAVTYEPNACRIDLYCKTQREKFYVSEQDGHLTIDYSILAKAVYNAGYRKIPEGAVVILDEEMEEFAENLMKSPQMQKTMNGLIKAWKKETAEKFAEMVSKAFVGLNCIDIDEWNWCQKKIDEICKEITEGKV